MTTGPHSRGAAGRAAAAESRAKAGGALSDPRSAGRHREAQTRPARRASRRRARVGGQSDAAVTPRSVGSRRPWDEASAVRGGVGGRPGLCRHLRGRGAKAFGAGVCHVPTTCPFSGSRWDCFTKTSPKRRERGRGSGKIQRRGRTEQLCGTETGRPGAQPWRRPRRADRDGPGPAPAGAPTMPPSLNLSHWREPVDELVMSSEKTQQA